MSDYNAAQNPTDGKGTGSADPTADYRKYPKGPNFLGIVIGACVVILLVFAAALLLLHKDASHLVPQHQNPAPNSRMQPLLPAPGIALT